MLRTRSAVLRIKVLSCPELFLSLDEVTDILRHRFVFVLICLTSAPSVGVYLAQREWVSAACMILLPILVLSVLAVAIRWQVRRSGHGNLTTVYMSVHLGFISVGAAAIQLFAQKGLALPEQSDLPGLVLWALWSYAVAEMATWLFVTFLLPRIQVDLLNQQARTSDISANLAMLAKPNLGDGETELIPNTYDSLGRENPAISATPYIPISNVDYADEVDTSKAEGIFANASLLVSQESLKKLKISSESLNFADLLYLRIERNYLDVVTTKRKFLVRGTLSEAIDKMPAQSGVLIHRSLWVTSHAIVKLVQNSGDLYLLLINGEEVKVARHRKKIILDYLKLVSSRKKLDSD